MTALLIVHHSPTRSMEQLTERLVAGANDPEIDGVDVVVRAALETTAEDLLAADGYVLATPANFGYMSGTRSPVPGALPSSPVVTENDCLRRANWEVRQRGYW